MEVGILAMGTYFRIGLLFIDAHLRSEYYFWHQVLN